SGCQSWSRGDKPRGDRSRCRIPHGQIVSGERFKRLPFTTHHSPFPSSIYCPCPRPREIDHVEAIPPLGGVGIPCRDCPALPGFRDSPRSARNRGGGPARELLVLLLERRKL